MVGITRRSGGSAQRRRIRCLPSDCTCSSIRLRRRPIDLRRDGGGATESTRQDPHAVRIAGKSFRYTLEMAAVQGHKLPGGVMGNFKKMQEALGVWHDYVVLTERAMQMSLEALLPHHDAALQAKVLDLARALLKHSSNHLDQFSALWAKGGGDVARGSARSVSADAFAQRTDKRIPIRLAQMHRQPRQLLLQTRFQAT